MQSLAIQDDEQILLWLNKHWIILTRDIIGTVLAGVLPIFGVTFLISSGITTGLNPALLTFLLALWLIAVWMSLVIVWTNYYLDVWIVTDKRIINVEQLALFRRDVTTLRYERLQDATVKYNGFISEMFDFGTLKIQTAGFDTHEMEFEGIPHPEEVKRMIFDQVDKSAEGHQQSHGFKAQAHLNHDI